MLLKYVNILDPRLYHTLLEADKLVEDEEHYFPQEKKLRQPAPGYNCVLHFFYDEFITRELDYSLRGMCFVQE